MNRFDAVQQVADTLLFDGYVLYPSRGSDGTNRVRRPFGVLMPPDYCAVDTSERGWSQTECLLDGDHAALTVRVRFLQAQRRSVLDADQGEVASLQTEDASYVPGDEAVVRTVDLTADLAKLPRQAPFTIDGGTELEAIGSAGFLRRTRLPVTGVVALSSTPMHGPYGVTRLRIRVENTTPDGSSERVGALRQALIAHHVLVAADGCRFLSLLEPPEWATTYVAGCENVGVFPVLADDDLLSSPIILDDHPRIAPESQGDLSDAVDLDETRTGRGADPRAAELLAGVDTMPQEFVDHLHGTIRYLRRISEPEPATPWWHAGDTTGSPETEG
jgi:hypothetical protein